MDGRFFSHPIPPVYDGDSRILILGSFPSVKSRECGFFYGHPRNRFWKLLALIKGAAVPRTTAEKKAFLLRERIALWDVVASCVITGSHDSSIRGAEPNDIRLVTANSRVEKILLNGTKAAELFRRFFSDAPLPPAFALPSTSPANAAWSLEKLAARWKEALAVSLDV